MKAVIALGELCYSGGELPGTVNISRSVFFVMMDICSEFFEWVFKNLWVFLGHGEPGEQDALTSSLQMFLRRNQHLKDITISLVGCWELSPTWLNYFNMEPEHDFHAGEVETALMMYWKPELVRDTIVMDEPHIAYMMRTDCDWFEIAEKTKDHPFVIPRARQREEIKVGVMGFPEKATKELGEKICIEMVNGLIDYVEYLNSDEK